MLNTGDNLVGSQIILNVIYVSSIDTDGRPELNVVNFLKMFGTLLNSPSSSEGEFGENKTEAKFSRFTVFFYMNCKLIVC